MTQSQPYQPRALQPFDTSSAHIRSVLAALGTRCFIPRLPRVKKRSS